MKDVFNCLFKHSMALIFNDRNFSFSAMFNRIETACPRNGKLQGAKRLLWKMQGDDY
jgi:hypothetical protein